MHRLILAAAACLVAGTACAQDTDSARYEARLLNNELQEVGRISLAQGPSELVIRIEADGLGEAYRSAWHGAHLHAVGSCASSDFTSSGGHINPSGRAHGLLNPDGPDNADMPNLWVHADGALRAEATTTRVSLNGENGVPALLDEDGSALVVHALPDDHLSQPIGGAGARILCAEILAD